MSTNAHGADHVEPGSTPQQNGASSGSKRKAPGDPPSRSTEAVVATLASLPVELSRLMDGRSREELARAAQDGGWGLVEILPHLRDWELIYRDRLEQILTEDEPTLEEYDDSLWAIEHAYSDQDPDATFEEFAELRGALIERLRPLSEEDWDRPVILPKRGRVTLHWLMDNLCDHDAKHLVQARDVLA